MNIVVVTEKWCDLNPNLGTTSGNSNILGSLKCTKNSFEVFHYDEYLANSGHPIDNFLVNHVKNNKPDLVFVSYFPVDNDPRNIQLETFKIIKDMGIPVCFLWFDAVHPHIEQLAIKCSQYNTLNVVIDTSKYISPKFINMWVPQDERLFNWQNQKNHDVCFVGTKSYEERQRYLNFLKNKINLTISGGQREHRLTIEQYSQLLKDSKISLNFPSKPDGSTQCKSRVYESMLCGAMLMERTNDAINKWFEPMIHYIPFDNENDLLKKIRYYLKNDSEREAIAQNGYQKMKDCYSSQNWWDAVINKARSLM
jgi:spore maturation protein CgeB